MNEEEIMKRFDDLEKRVYQLENSSLKKSFNNKNDFGDCIFEEQDENIIVTKIIGNGIKEKTQNIVLLTLLGYKQKLNEVELRASKLRENVALHEVPLENFGTHVKGLIPQSILKKGKLGSNKITYKLTTFGEAKAQRLLREIGKNDN